MPAPIGIQPEGDKLSRTEAQLTDFESGRVILPRHAPWLGEFLNELLAFPNSRHDDQAATFKLRAGDIVMGRRGEMGRCAVVTEQEDGWLCGTGSLILRLPDSLYPKYVAMLIGSPYVREYLGGSAVGATMQNLNQSILLKMSIGLPPLAEQHRIVAKVDEVRAICDLLEASLASGDDTRCRLLDALLHEALAPSEDGSCSAVFTGANGFPSRVYRE